MPAAVIVEVDEAQYDRLRRELAGIPFGVQKATVGAINKTVAQGRTVVVDKLFDLLAIRRRGDILRHTTTVPATVERPVGKVVIDGRRIGLINFTVKDTRTKRGRGKAGNGRGVTAQVYRHGDTWVLPHAFIATGASGNRHVFQRQPVGGGKLSPRLPIVSKQGLSLFKVYQDTPAIEAASLARIRTIFNEQLLSQIDRLLGRRKVDRPAA